MSVSFTVEPEPRHARSVPRVGGDAKEQPRHCACLPCIFGFGHVVITVVS